MLTLKLLLACCFPLDSNQLLLLLLLLLLLRWQLLVQPSLRRLQRRTEKRTRGQLVNRAAQAHRHQSSSRLQLPRGKRMHSLD
jgi:hypothetical protein